MTNPAWVVLFTKIAGLVTDAVVLRRIRPGCRANSAFRRSSARRSPPSASRRVIACESTGRPASSRFSRDRLDTIRPISRRISCVTRADLGATLELGGGTRAAPAPGEDGMHAVSRIVLREQVKELLLAAHPRRRVPRRAIGSSKPGSPRSSAPVRHRSERRFEIWSCFVSSSRPRSGRPRARGLGGRALRSLPRASRRSRNWRPVRRRFAWWRCRAARGRARRDATVRSDAGDLHGLVEHDVRFHRVIVEAADNRICSTSGPAPRRGTHDHHRSQDRHRPP